MAIIKDVTVKINNGTATLDAPVQFYEKDHDVELRFKLLDYKYKYDKDPQNILNSVDEDVLEAYTTIVNPRGYELEQINGVVKNDVVIFRLDPTYTDELDELGTYKLQIHIKCTHSEFTIPPITFEVLQRLKGIKVVTDGEDEVDNSEILDNSSKFVSDETGKLIIEWKKGDMISSAKLNAMVDVINDAVDEEAQRQLNEAQRQLNEAKREQQELERQNELQEALDSVDARVDESMIEYETRFNALTASQQQDMEVIDARDGEVSLKARLDRDLRNPLQVYEDVEDSHISCDSTEGYAQNIEILGNTIQDADNLADIRSVGGEIENQELYEIPVLSRGKNLFGKSNANIGYIIDPNTGGLMVDANNGNCSSDYIRIFADKKYSHNKRDSGGFAIYDLNKNFVEYSSLNNAALTNHSFGVDGYIRLNIGKYVLDTFQLEEGTVATEYEPYVEDKLTILSPVQLEKVGDVADRIICKDGVWGVEKNVNSGFISSSDNWILQRNNGTVNRFACITTNMPFTDFTRSTNNVISNKFIASASPADYIIGCSFGNNDGFIVHTNIKDIPTLADFKNFIGDGVFVKYPTTQPQFIPLPHDQQIKLRTFASKTNIHFECEIEPTLKASIPKSLGASVSSNTTQIDNLSKELQKINNLEESVTREVVSESDLITVENTSNGYFEDVKLDGRTLLLNADNEVVEPGTEGATLKSVGQDVDEISVLSINENLFDGIFESGDINSAIGTDEGNIERKRSNYIEVEPNNAISFNIIPLRVVFYDSNKQFILFANGKQTYTTPANCKYIRFSVDDTVNDVMLVYSSEPKSYKPHKQDKKRILYYNDETQTWEKPILRQWDSIEKHSDGKYYYHKRSGEIHSSQIQIINKLDTSYDNNETIVFSIGTSDFNWKKIKGEHKAFICDKFNVYDYNTILGKDSIVEGMTCETSFAQIYCRIYKSKLSTQDIQGFKAWLQANLTTVVYQLAEEKVYECTNLDLITYADETNLLVKSGVLNPKVSLKASNGVGNVVTMLQNKVTMLEQMVYDLMKMFNNQQSNIDE